MFGNLPAGTAVLSPNALAAAEAAIASIPPLWPLASSVAVNSFLGQAGEPLESAAARLARTAGVAVTMPRGWFGERIGDGRIGDDDLAAALAAASWRSKPASVPALRAALDRPVDRPRALATVADLAASISGIDWPAIIAERIGHWAAGYFDEGQALWRVQRGRGAYAQWRETAIHDLTPEVLGLAGFARFVASAPETARGAIARSVAALSIRDSALESVFARAMSTLGGWAQYARCLLFQAELEGRSDDTALELLAIRLMWDEALLAHYGEELGARWNEVCAAHATRPEASDDQRIDAVLQHAAELGTQRDLNGRLASGGFPVPQPPAIQAAFCIDVRSEVYRRALESVDPGIATLGFAGFFGLATAHRRFASDVVEKRLPVLLNPGSTSVAGGHPATDAGRRYAARAARAWGRFKLAAVSSFAFVESAGPLYVAKLLRDALGSVGAPQGDPAPRFDPPLTLDAKVDTAETILRAMSLTRGFAPLVLIVGHGARVTNNPHASALQCGACGGYSGEVNARLLAGLLNEPEVRARLSSRDIHIPAKTMFVAALHDTTSHAVTLFDSDGMQEGHRPDLEGARRLLDRASEVARAECAPKLPGATDGPQLLRRARNWAEVRPEWGLAGARAFVAAPRSMTCGRSLEGQAFLHDYDWRADAGFSVLELILTAPVVVASWISLQYYGSSVAPELFGGGNKLLHNITGGIGVVEGNGGTLRGGLPWQSVHDGRALMHDPLRLTVCVAAPADAIDAVLTKHAHVRALFDNRWMHLLVLDDHGRMAERYDGVGRWTSYAAHGETEAA